VSRVWCTARFTHKRHPFVRSSRSQLRKTGPRVGYSPGLKSAASASNCGRLRARVSRGFRYRVEVGVVDGPQSCTMLSLTQFAERSSTQTNLALERVLLPTRASSKSGRDEEATPRVRATTRRQYLIILPLSGRWLTYGRFAASFSDLIRAISR
jgi:hypothetical protein